MITQNGVLNVYVSERDLTGLSDGADSVLVEVAEAPCGYARRGLVAHLSGFVIWNLGVGGSDLRLRVSGSG